MYGATRECKPIPQALDPALVDQMQTSCREDDTTAMREHVAALVEAANEELASRSP
jgi:hypothetical protein